MFVLFLLKQKCMSNVILHIFFYLSKFWENDRIYKMKPIFLILCSDCYFSLLNENVIFRSVFRALSNIYNGLFLELKTVNYFCKKNSIMDCWKGPKYTFGFDFWMEVTPIRKSNTKRNCRKKAETEVALYCKLLVVITKAFQNFSKNPQ